MTAIFDTNIIVYLVQPDAPSSTERVTERVVQLIDELAAMKASIIIPAPVLAELLSYADGGDGIILAKLKKIKKLSFGKFDERAAIELAQLERNIRPSGVSSSEFIGSRSKLKFDKLIVAIALRYKSPTLYSDDKNVVRIANRIGLNVVSSNQLPLPPEEPQQGFEFEAKY